MMQIQSTETAVPLLVLLRRGLPAWTEELILVDLYVETLLKQRLRLVMTGIRSMGTDATLIVKLNSATAVQELVQEAAQLFAETQLSQIYQKLAMTRMRSAGMVAPLPVKLSLAIPAMGEGLILAALHVETGSS